MFVRGGGGIAVVTVDVLLSCNQSVSCVIDSHLEADDLLGVPVVQSIEQARQRYPDIRKGLICIGDNPTRRALADTCNLEYTKAISPSATVSRHVQIGVGAMVFQRAIIQARTQIGTHVIVNTTASVDHDCVIGNFVHIGPNSTLCGHVTICDDVYVGAACTFIPGVTVGAGSIIGAGSVVLSDIPAKSLAVGTPARVVRSW